MPMLDDKTFQALKECVSYILDTCDEWEHLVELLNSGPNTHREREHIKRNHIATKAMTLRIFISAMEDRKSDDNQID